MPELPEVETICRSLCPQLVGREILDVRTTTAMLRLPLCVAALRDCCVGRAVVDVRRRGKYLIVELSGDCGLLIHLGMTGAFRIEPADAPASRHDRVAWVLSDGRVWRFADVRRFGSVQPCELPGAGATPACLQHLGPEPLGSAFTGDYLHCATRGRRRPIKNLIMDQGVVVGVGNIYANEALFRAGLRPRRASGRLSRAACLRLVAAVKEVLEEAISYGGTTISDYRQVDGTEGKFRTRLDAYGRHGEPCPRCGDGALIRRVVLGGRASFYCPRCQR